MKWAPVLLASQQQMTLKLPTVIVLAENERGEIALVQRHAPLVNKSFWQVPSEEVEPHENYREAATRCAIQDLCVRPEAVEVIGEFYIDPSTVQQRAGVCLCTTLNISRSSLFQGDFEAEVITGVRWVTIQEVANMVKTKQIEDAWTVTALMYYQLYRISIVATTLESWHQEKSTSQRKI
jgi:hypothetical protein